MDLVIGADGDSADGVAVMEQTIGQDEQANKFSAEVRIRKTQVLVLYASGCRLLSHIFNLFHYQ